MCIPRSGVAGSYSSSIFIFWVFHGNCSSLHSHEQYRRVLSTPHPCQHLSFVDMLMVAIPVGVTWYLTVVLICICLMISNVEYYFICLWPVIFPIQRSVYLGPFPFFKIGLFVFVVLRCINSLYILEINSLLGVSLVNMFSHKVGSHFILLMVSFAVQKFLVWYSPTCLFFSFVSFALGGISAKILLHEMSEILLLFFFFW